MIKRIIIFLLIFTATFLLNGCEPENFDNKPVYEIKVGETFNYYVSSNSCCPNCWLNQKTMASIELLEVKVVDPAKDDCDGCTSWSAYIFRAVKPGKDTIKYFAINPFDSCSPSILDSFKIKPAFSIVNVTN